MLPNDCHIDIFSADGESTHSNFLRIEIELADGRHSGEIASQVEEVVVVRCPISLVVVPRQND